VKKRRRKVFSRLFRNSISFLAVANDRINQIGKVRVAGFVS
jgi:hypothetical protein